MSRSVKSGQRWVKKVKPKWVGAKKKNEHEEQKKLFVVLPASCRLISPETLTDAFTYLSRSELETLCLVSRQFHQIIQKHFPTAPFRIILRVQLGIADSNIVLEMDCYEGAKFRTFHEDEYGIISLFPRLQSKQVRAIETSLLLLETRTITEEHMENMKLIEHVWRENNFTIDGYCLTRILAYSPTLLQCSHLQVKCNKFQSPSSYFQLQQLHNYSVLYGLQKLIFHTYQVSVELMGLVEFVHARQMKGILRLENYSQNCDMGNFIRAIKERFINSTRPISFTIELKWENIDDLSEATLEPPFLVKNPTTGESLQLSTTSSEIDETFDIVAYFNNMSMTRNAQYVLRRW